jgi:SAM domain (Sterile alpha motif)
MRRSSRDDSLRQFWFSGEFRGGGLVRPIEEWLGDLGLGEYAARFVENGIDLSAVPCLTDDDLKELGVLPWPSAETDGCDCQSGCCSISSGSTGDRIVAAIFGDAPMPRRGCRHWRSRAR